jgi:DNA (cytosine-5)-methyltransferase 1
VEIMLRVLDLFSGIGGFSLGLERTGGFKTVAFCEIEPYARRVLAKHWPEVPVYDDVRRVTADGLCADGIGVDFICGGFPCQDISIAGLGAGIEGARSGLWAEFSRLIGELRPSFVIVENVAALLFRGLGRVLGDLAALGYDAEWHCIPASCAGLPQERDRIWIVAYPMQLRMERLVKGANFGADGQGRRKGSSTSVQHVSKFALVGTDRFPKPLLCGMDERVPHWMDRVAAVGNAVVPQIPEMIGRAILAADSTL